MSKVALIPVLKSEQPSSKPATVSEDQSGGDFGKAFKAATTEKSGNSGKRTPSTNKPKQTGSAGPPVAEQQAPTAGEAQSLSNQSQGLEVITPLQLAVAATLAGVDLMPKVDLTQWDQTPLTDLGHTLPALDSQSDLTKANPAEVNPMLLAAVAETMGVNPPVPAIPGLEAQSELADPSGEPSAVTVSTESSVTATTLGLLNPELTKLVTETVPKPVGESTPKAPDFAALLKDTQSPAPETAVPEVLPTIAVETDGALKITAASERSLSGVTGLVGRWQNYHDNRLGMVQPHNLQAEQVADGNAAAVADFSVNLLSGLTEQTPDQKVLNLSVLQSKFALDESPAKSWNDPAVQLNSVAPAFTGDQPLPAQISQVNADTNPINREHVFTQIVEHAKLNLSNGQSQMELQLKPDNLGKIQLKISMENQLVTARFVAESDQVKQIIETNLNVLKRSLYESGIQVDSMMVAVGQQNHSGAFQHSMNGQGSSSQQNFSGGRSNRGETVNEDLPIPAEPVRPVPTANSMINLIA